MIKVKIERNMVPIPLEYEDPYDAVELIKLLLIGHQESYPLVFEVRKWFPKDGGEEE